MALRAVVWSCRPVGEGYGCTDTYAGKEGEEKAMTAKLVPDEIPSNIMPDFKRKLKDGPWCAFCLAKLIECECGIRLAIQQSIEQEREEQNEHS